LAAVNETITELNNISMKVIDMRENAKLCKRLDMLDTELVALKSTGLHLSAQVVTLFQINHSLF
jgi:hypothetical protein